MPKVILITLLLIDMEQMTMQEKIPIQITTMVIMQEQPLIIMIIMPKTQMDITIMKIIK